MPEPLSSQLLSQLLKDLHVAFPRNLGAQNPQLMADVYRNGLRGLSGDAVRWAVAQAIQEEKYFPKVSRLRELATAWNRANRIEVESQIVRPSGWCEWCHTAARPEKRWRPKVDEKGRRILDGAGRIWLEQFERIRCACDAPPRYEPDDPTTEYMTENRRPAA